ncbi:MAG: exonuclease SbcCD subunit D [Clostridia bacterium]|nr:exonuclease SbcCD subunit D [Clostridia bacterium]
MNSVKILHCADLHIGAAESFLNERAESRRAETLITFENIIKAAKQNDVDIMLIAGDLFNSNNIEKSFINRVFDCMASIPDVKIVIAAGNHDPLSFNSPYKTNALPNNVFVLDTKDCFVEFADLNTRVYGKSFKEVYMQGASSFSIKPDADFINLMCIHGELRSDLGSDYNSITNSFIENCGMDYIALGHVHKRSDISKAGCTYFAYCGCPEGQGFDELGEKGVYVGDISKDGCNLKFIPTAKRMHIADKIDISGCDTAAEIADFIINEIKQEHGDNYSDNLYKIILTGALNDGVDISIPEIASRLNSSLYFAKVKDKTEINVDFDALSQEQSLKGIFVKKMLEKINSADIAQKEILKSALNIGLKAFTAEVNYDED